MTKNLLARNSRGNGGKQKAKQGRRSKIMARKSNALLLNIPGEQQEALEHWLFAYSPGHTNAQAQHRLKQEFGVEATIDQIGRFYHRKAREKVVAQMVADGMAGSPLWGAMSGGSEVFETLLEMTARLAVEKVAKEGATLPTKDLKALAAIAMLGIKAKEQEEKAELKEEELELQRERVAVQKTVAEAKQREAAAYEREVVLSEAKFKHEQEQWERKNNPPEPKLLTDEDWALIEMKAKFM
jgi:hypothetical protein